MSFSSMRYCLVAMASFAISGCYSGGQWTMPNLAFWKTNPFSTTAKSNAPEAIPRPSVLAGQPSPAPGAGYTSGTSNTGNTLAPAYPTTAASTAVQQPYTASQPSMEASAYMAPQEGYYNPGSVGGTTTHTATNPYAVSPPQAASAPPAYSSNPYGAPGSYGSPAPFGAEPSYSAQPAGSPSGYVAANPSGPYANPVRDDARQSYDARLADYRSTAGAYATPVPDYRGGGDQQSYGYDYRNPTADYRNQPAGNPAYAPPPQNDQGAAAPTNNYGGNTVQGYYPPPGGYTPGNTGYNPQGVPPYQTPTVSGSPPSPAGYQYDPGYMPGSIGRYQP
jgi:hypothetical protein